jgi:molybdate transport system ATP-binding protein
MSADTLTLRARLSFAGFGLDVDEELELNGVTALFGPNGSGKSTLLRTIAGFARPREGRIALGKQTWFDSAAGIDLPPYRRPVGYMFQDGRLFEHRSVAGNLAFADRRSGRGTAGYDRTDIVDALDLHSLLHRRIGSLSGGERQRVALGRTLLTRPELLLLDEPLSALDRERKVEILPYIEQLPTRFGIPTIYVSHAIEEVARLAEKVVVLADGRVLGCGSSASIMERLDLQPVTGRFEAGVLVDASVTGHDRRLALTQVDVGGDELVMPMIERLNPGDNIRLRIRARDVAVATSRPEGISIRNILPATISEIVPEPDTAMAELLLALKQGHIRARLTRASVEDLKLAVGTAVFALVKTVSFDRRLL